MKGTVVSTWIRTCRDLYGNDTIDKCLRAVNWPEDIVFTPLEDVDDDKIFKFINITANTVGVSSNELWKVIGENNLNKFQYLIKGNLIPQIDVFLDNGYTKEEMKMINETKKILKDNSLKITATCVRVPVENSHSESINIEFENSVTLDGILNELKNSKGLILMDDIQTNTYPMPKYISGKDEVYVGRVRIDESCTNSINIWVVADNILKGAALNAIQIAEYIIENKRR